jgi:hypothetical protein
MPHLRYQSPDRLVGATDFSDEQLRGSLNAVKLVKSQKWVWDSLREACDLSSNYARKREPGHWELACVAFIASKQVDIRPWWDEAALELWKACGFKARPSYMRTWRRLRELETVCDEFLAAASLVIRRCNWHDPRVMAHGSRPGSRVKLPSRSSACCGSYAAITSSALTVTGGAGSSRS